MSLPRRWLARFLDEVFGPTGSIADDAPRGSRQRVRRVVAASFAHRGLAFGAPLLRREQQISRDAGDLVRLVRWLAVIADHIELAGRMLDDAGLPAAERRARRRRALGAALGLVYCDDEVALLLASDAVPARLERSVVTFASRECPRAS